MDFLKRIASKIHKDYIKLFVRIKNETKKQNIYFKSSTTKHSMNSCCTLKLSVETEKKKLAINEKLKPVIKKYMNNPDKLLKYVELQGIAVYRFNRADTLLSKIGEEEGFLTPLKGIKALTLNLILKIFAKRKGKINFTTPAMFIFNTNNNEIYTIARAIHKYYGYKNKLPGFDYKSQEIFKRAANNKNQTPPFAKCSIKDMYACKEAIARDLESINFTIELSLEYNNAKEVLKKIQTKESTNV